MTPIISHFYTYRRAAIILAVFAGIAITFSLLPAPNKEAGQQNYICTKKTGKKPPRHIINITFIERGVLSKTCVSSQKKKRVMQSDCGKAISHLVEKGFTCKKTGLDLN